MTLVVFHPRDPALITNDNLESNMEQDDTVPASTYAVKGMSLGFEVTPEQAKQVVTMKTTGRYNLTDHMTQPSLAVHGKPVDIKPFQADPTQEMLNDMSSPYNIEPATLVNLWAVRFGKEWVGTEAVANAEETEFWQHATNRLRELGCIEMHTLASSYRVVLRIVE